MNDETNLSGAYSESLFFVLCAIFVLHFGLISINNKVWTSWK